MRRNLSRKASSPTKPTSETRVPPSTSRDFHKMGRRRERSPFRRELEKKRYGWWLSLSLHCSPERGLQAFPLKGAPFQGHPRWKKLRTGIR